jgi:glycogen synthase
LLQVCIVSSTGGLVDTVKEGYTGFHMGAFNVEVKAVAITLFDLFVSCILDSKTRYFAV